MRKFIILFYSIFLLLVNIISGQVFSEDFGTIANSTNISTSNTNFDYVRIGTGGGGITAVNPNNVGGTGSSMNIGGSTSTSLNGVGISGLASSDIVSVYFRLTSSNFSLGDLFIGTGTGTMFTGNGTFSTGDLLFGIQINNGDLEYRTSSWNSGSFTFSNNTDYEIHIIANNTAGTMNYNDLGGNSNDIAAGKMDLWINGALQLDDVDLAGNQSSTALRIYQVNGSQYYEIDDIKMYNSAQDVLPVELTSFSAEYENNSVQLNWETATETNNAGFEVQRQNSELGTQNSEWEVLTFIPGHGTTNSPKYYSYIDSDLPKADKVSYRLRQIDNDGTDAYSKTVEVDLGGVTSVEDEMQFEFALEQNYPNPFNPVTTINFTLPSVGTTHELSLQAKLTVYNLLGQEVHTLVNEVKSAGSYQIQFDASDLPSGIYFYSLTYGNHNQTRKLALLK